MNLEYDLGHRYPLLLAQTYSLSILDISSFISPLYGCERYNYHVYTIRNVVGNLRVEIRVKKKMEKKKKKRMTIEKKRRRRCEKKKKRIKREKECEE